MTGPSPLRIALFSEVYWPMVSGVGVTLLRLTDALRAGGTMSGSIPPPTRLPQASPTARGPPLPQRPAFPLP